MAWLVDFSATVLLFSLLMYVLLDGTDLGVGMLCIFFGDEAQKRPMVRSLLPVWDANETWLVLLAGGLFTLFPAAYALILSSLYIPVFLMLLSLLLRAMALEYREAVGERMHRALDKVLPLASCLAAFCQGAGAGVLISGDMSQGAFTWLNFYPVLCGLGLTTAYLFLGCCWVRWRVAEGVDRKAIQLGWVFLVMGLVLFLAIIWRQPLPWRHALQLPLGMMLFLLVTLLWPLLIAMFFRTSPFLILTVTLILISAVIILLGIGIYPDLIPGAMTLKDAAAGETTQLFVLYGIVLIIPVTLIYHSWAFWVFRGKVK